MTSRRFNLEPAFVLHPRPFRDTSLIVEVFTANHGRQALVARGARRPKARQRSLLQGFRPLLMSWRTSGEMGTLTGVEGRGEPRRLRGDALMAGFYLNELLMRLLQRADPHPGLFAIYDASLSKLEGADSIELARVLRFFEKRLLDELGVGLPLDGRTMDGQRLDPNASYHFDPEAGARAVPEGSPGTVSGATLLALAEERLDNEEVLAESRQLLSRALESQLGGRALLTRQVLQALRRRGLLGTGAPESTPADRSWKDESNGTT